MTARARPSSSRCGRRRTRCRRMPAGRVRDRALAARQDGVLRVGSQSRPHRLRHRQRGRRRSRPGARVVLARRRARGRQRRAVASSYTEEAGQRVMKKRRDHGPRDARPRRCVGDRLDLRFFARLRQHQRRLPQLTWPRRARALAHLLLRVEGILERVEGLLPPAPSPTDWSAHAFRWRKRAGRGYLEAVLHPHAIRLDDLVAIDEQKRAIDANTRQFVAGLPANNVLFTGSRGTGKSSLVKAMLVKYAGKGLRLIEVDKSDLVELPDIAAEVATRRERFLVFCDDLSFDAGDPGYKALKVMLDGTIAAAGREPADLRHVESPPSDAGIFQRESRDEALRRRGASRRIGRGEDLALRALRPLGVVLSVQPGRLSRGGRDRGCPRSASLRRNPRARPRRARAKRCSSRCSAARGAAASHGSSRRSYAGAAGLRRKPGA